MWMTEWGSAQASRIYSKLPNYALHLVTTAGRVFAVNWSLEKTIPLSPLIHTCLLLLVLQHYLHHPSLQSCHPLLLSCPSLLPRLLLLPCLLTHPSFLFPFLNDNCPRLPTSIPKTLRLSAHISQIMSH